MYQRHNVSKYQRHNVSIRRRLISTTMLSGSRCPRMLEKRREKPTHPLHVAGNKRTHGRTRRAKPAAVLQLGFTSHPGVIPQMWTCYSHTTRINPHTHLSKRFPNLIQRAPIIQERVFWEIREKLRMWLSCANGGGRVGLKREGEKKKEEAIRRAS